MQPAATSSTFPRVIPTALLAGDYQGHPGRNPHALPPGESTACEEGRSCPTVSVPLRAGSFCSSLFLLRLKREELCRRSFFTIWGPPEYLILFSWVGGGALLLGRLFEVVCCCCCCGCCCGCWACDGKESQTKLTSFYLQGSQAIRHGQYLLGLKKLGTFAPLHLHFSTPHPLLRGCVSAGCTGSAICKAYISSAHACEVL